MDEENNNSPDFSDNNWLLLFLLMAFGFENNQKTNGINTYIDLSTSNNKNSLYELQKNCECIEWEQDMGAHIPFCRLDGQLCDGQCQKRNGESNRMART